MASRGKDWHDDEIGILRELFPKYGTSGVLRALAAHGYRRSPAAVSTAATMQGLRRADFDPAEDRVLREGVAAGLYYAEISARLAEADWDRDAATLGRRARALGIWRRKRASRDKARRHEDTMRARLLGGPYRALTDITPWLIRLYYSQGDSAEYIAADMKRPVWLVRAILAGEPWQERWRAERAARGLEASA